MMENTHKAQLNLNRSDYAGLEQEGKIIRGYAQYNLATKSSQQVGWGCVYWGIISMSQESNPFLPLYLALAKLLLKQTVLF